jgi:hypothetical protein
MSKIGRKPIFFKNVQVEVDKNKVSYKGSHANGLYEVDSRLEVKLFNDNLVLSPIAAEVNSKDINMIWGLHRALLNNAIQGSAVLFEKHIRIEGLGFKAEPQQNNVNPGQTSRPKPANPNNPNKPQNNRTAEGVKPQENQHKLPNNKPPLTTADVKSTSPAIVEGGTLEKPTPNKNRNKNKNRNRNRKKQNPNASGTENSAPSEGTN